MSFRAAVVLNIDNTIIMERVALDFFLKTKNYSSTTLYIPLV
jgi:hypothetical protein